MTLQKLELSPSLVQYLAVRFGEAAVYFSRPTTQSFRQINSMREKINLQLRGPKRRKTALKRN